MEKIMNISPVDNSNSFKGTLIVNNLKRNTSLSINTTKEMDKQLIDQFQKVVNNGKPVFSSPKECIRVLKDYVKSISAITKTKLVRVKYPAQDELALMYNATKTKSQIDVPEHFSITHIFK